MDTGGSIPDIHRGMQATDCGSLHAFAVNRLEMFFPMYPDAEAATAAS